MKQANLISVLSAYRTLPLSQFESYIQYHSINIRPQELNDLEVLVGELKSLSNSIQLFDKYFIGYKIPQIGKEFDLLRLDDESVVNIEIKKISTLEKTKAQLERNSYYLSFLKKKMFIFSFVANDKKLYKIDYNGNLVEVGIRELLAALVPQNVKKIDDIDSYFNPKHYLISPFNSTEEFIKGNYFLTTHQELIKTTILNQLETPNYSILSIKGKAGTGKTLLTYNIANVVLLQKPTLIIHCGILNSGHEVLRDGYGWDIISIKDIRKEGLLLTKYHLIIIDEAQRIKPDQLDYIIAEAKKSSSNCIFSLDPEQTLKKGEIRNNIESKLLPLTTFKPFELTTKIRANKQIISFIESLVNKNRPLDNYRFSNIEVNYFNDYNAANAFLMQLKSEDWKLINYTPSQYSRMPYDNHKIHGELDTAHTVIGQEFDNVVAVIDEHFVYKGARLSTHRYSNRPVYHPTKMLFQIASRAKIKLGVVVINNPEVLERCMRILSQ